MGLAESDGEAQSDIAGLRAGLEELGWNQGRNIAIDLRWGAGDSNRMREFAAELVDLHPDLLIAHTTGPTIALREVTDTIPDHLHPDLRSYRQWLHHELGKSRR